MSHSIRKAFSQNLPARTLFSQPAKVGMRTAPKQPIAHKAANVSGVAVRHCLRSRNCGSGEANGFTFGFPYFTHPHQFRLLRLPQKRITATREIVYARDHHLVHQPVAQNASL